MKTKHTPGPWKTIEHGWSQTGIYADGAQIAIIDIYDEATEENQNELEARTAANARLIAAAPDLLDALKTVVEFYSYAELGPIAAAREVISKATGEPA